MVDVFEQAGFVIDDVVTESSRGYSLRRLPVDVHAVLRRAVTDGRVQADRVQAWLREQEQRSEDGRFRASWDKVLVVGHRV
jgi:hypothetical protein